MSCFCSWSYFQERCSILFASPVIILCSSALVRLFHTFIQGHLFFVIFIWGGLVFIKELKLFLQVISSAFHSFTWKLRLLFFSIAISTILILHLWLFSPTDSIYSPTLLSLLFFLKFIFPFYWPYSRIIKFPPSILLFPLSHLCFYHAAFWFQHSNYQFRSVFVEVLTPLLEQ